MKDKLYAIGFAILFILWIIFMLDGCLGYCNPDGSNRGPLELKIQRNL